MTVPQPGIAPAQDGQASPRRLVARVVATRWVVPGVAATTLEAPELARRAEPLQFVQVQVQATLGPAVQAGWPGDLGGWGARIGGDGSRPEPRAPARTGRTRPPSGGPGSEPGGRLRGRATGPGGGPGDGLGIPPAMAPAAVGRPFLGRPFSVVGVDEDSGRITLVYRVIGPATTALAALPPGSLLPLLGPLGRPAPPAWTQAGVGVAGGGRPLSGPRPLLLVAPGWQVLALRLLAARARAAGVPVTVLSVISAGPPGCAGSGRLECPPELPDPAYPAGPADGAPGGSAPAAGPVAVRACPEPRAETPAVPGVDPSAALTALWQELPPAAPPVTPLVVPPEGDAPEAPDALVKALRAQPGFGPDPAMAGRVVAAGPAPFLRRVQAALAGTAAEGFLVVDAYMPCGYGTCLACAVPLRDPAGTVRYQRACSEGRWFPAAEVVLG